MDSQVEAIAANGVRPDVDRSFEWDGPRTRVVIAQAAIGRMHSVVEALGLRRVMVVAGGRTLQGPDYSRLRNPISEGQALQGIRILSRALPAMVAAPDDPYGRGQVQIGAHISGQVISNARVGIHHAVCHCLGGRGQLSHGVANSIMLPHAVAYNLEVARPEIASMAEALGVSLETGAETARAEAVLDALRAVQQGARVPTRLRDTGLDRALLSGIAEDTMLDRGLYFNPRRTESADEVLALLEAAW